MDPKLNPKAKLTEKRKKDLKRLKSIKISETNISKIKDTKKL